MASSFESPRAESPRTEPAGADSVPSDTPAEQVPGTLTRLAARAPWRRLPHPLRWITVAIIGTTFVLIGIALLVLPGPGIAFIVLGLAILATEFVWAETLLHRVKNGTHKAWHAARNRIRPTPLEPSARTAPQPE